MKGVITHSDWIYYMGCIKKVLRYLETSNNQPTSNIGSKIGRGGKDESPVVRKILRGMEQHGLIDNIDLGYNWHKWCINDIGLKEVEKIKEDMFYIIPFKPLAPSLTKT